MPTVHGFERQPELTSRTNKTLFFLVFPSFTSFHDRNYLHNFHQYNPHSNDIDSLIDQTNIDRFLDMDSMNNDQFLKIEMIFTF